MSPKKGKAVQEAVNFSSGVIERLSSYLNCLVQFRDYGYNFISSKDIGASTGVNPAEVRRDLIKFGSFGKKGLGYPVKELIDQLQHILVAEKTQNIALVGAGNLGTAIAHYEGLKKHGFIISAIFDNDPKKIGKKIGKLTIQNITKLESVVSKKNIKIGIIATPADAAHEIVNMLVKSGIKVIINYSEALIVGPPDVKVHNANPVVELLHTLYFLSVPKK